MGTYWTLANFTRRERVVFVRISGMKQAEIVGDGAATAVLAEYMFRCSGDDIAMVPDDRPFRGAAPYAVDVGDFTDVTDDVCAALVLRGVLRDWGTWVEQSDEPPFISGRMLRRVERLADPDVAALRAEGLEWIPPRNDGREGISGDGRRTPPEAGGGEP